MGASPLTHRTKITNFTLIQPWGGLFLLTLCLISMAGAFLGGVWAGAGLGAALALILDVIHFLWVRSSWRFVQDYSTTHPVKGQVLNLRVMVAQEAPIPGLGFELCLISKRAGRSGTLETVRGFFWGRKSLKTETQISCPFRGTYEAGIAFTRFYDLLGIFSWQQNQSPGTFYVQPGIKSAPLPSFTDSLFHGAEGQSGGIKDPGVFDGLEFWRPGESLRSISWRHLAGRGLWLKRKEGTIAAPGAALILDGRRFMAGAQDVSEDLLAAEDRSLETFLGLAQGAFDRSIPLTSLVNGPGMIPSSPGTFDTLYQACSHLEFGPGTTWETWFAAQRGLWNPGQVLMIVTHSPEPELELWVQRILSLGLRPGIYQITESWSDEVKISWQGLWDSMRLAGAEVFIDP